MGHYKKYAPGGEPSGGTILGIGRGVVEGWVPERDYNLVGGFILVWRRLFQEICQLSEVSEYKTDSHAL